MSYGTKQQTKRMIYDDDLGPATPQGSGEKKTLA